jgi:hypothetical protein
MLLYRRFLRALGVAAMAGLALGLACKGSNHGSSAGAGHFLLTGTVTYTRIPLAKDANGVPTGLMDSTVASNLQSLPARGVMIRAYRHVPQTQTDGSSVSVWLLSGSAYTDTSGNYSLTLPTDQPVMVEVLSSFSGGDGNPINLIADPAGVGSTVPEPQRLRYALRKALDGTTPAGNPAPSSMPSGSATTLNFTVGLTDPWWLVDPAVNSQTQVAPFTDQAVLETTLPGRTVGTGSRILAIGDSIATFVAAYGHASPGEPVDLHYAPGVSDVRGSFIEYDPAVYPLSHVMNSSTYVLTQHAFGSLQGGANDDAWDESVIFRLMARNYLFGGLRARTFGMTSDPLYPQSAQLTHLSPDQALIEGLTAAMAAVLLQSPYLADTEGTTLATPLVDIRDLSALAPDELSPDSAPAIRALAWAVILKANGITAPGAATDWAKITPAATARFFTAPAYPSGLTYETEPLNIFNQIGRLQEPKNATEPVDLASVFTDPVLTPLLAPFGVPWPRPSSGPLAAFATSWGADPNTLAAPLPPFPFSMADAVQVRGSYPNLSPGEVAYAGFTLSADRAYTLTVTASPALASTAQLELMMPSFQASPIFFTGSGGSQRVVLTGNATTPVFQPVRLRLLSPTTQQPDTMVTVSLVPAS